MSCQTPVTSIAKFTMVLTVHKAIKKKPIFLFMTHLFIGTMTSSTSSVASKVMAETIRVPLT